ncbi:NAD(P)/FAD-dependent oxidoreductase [Lentzea flaviverrucosa]|uniref:Reductase C-terminal n=1 Tax=Lentzea flaviverrucosa TaxID=200379 RepID=A0A1H9HBP3_9PSEU|nr:FAD-dependent oxidoreductase [Lentzea flaviverrucosa]RDI34640.1 NAD/ferredoxin-dependent reductase-like protein [Lentzea flaviverrucosa]SEQ59755.1 Reductase C-terminal [Lentzea flaviverrucosa]
MGNLERVVVVGASAAGVTTAETLRREGYTGRLTLVGDEEALPYDRPPLSKQVLAGAWEPERTVLRPESAYVDHDIELLLGNAACGLDLARRTVALSNGEELGYDGLVIATGTTPRTLPSGHDLAGVHVLRTVGDALALRGDLLRSSAVVVVGAGFLGTEAAAAARQLGLDVTLVDPLPLPLVRQFGDRVAAAIAELHEERGVRLRNGVGVVRLHGEGAVSGVELTDGTVVRADVVLVAIGAVPATGWLDGSGVPVDDGVVCDATCRAADGVYAAGDVARWFHPHFGGLMRVEHRMNATEQGMAVARTLLGAQTPFAPVPYFWTDQFDAKVQAYGVFPAGAEMSVAHGRLDERKFVAHYVVRGGVVGVLGWNMARQLRQDRQLVSGPPDGVRTGRTPGSAPRSA